MLLVCESHGGLSRVKAVSNILKPRSKFVQCANPCLTLLWILLERYMSMRLRRAARAQQQSPRISRAQAINLSCSQASSVSYQFSRKRTHPQITFLHITREVIIMISILSLWSFLQTCLCIPLKNRFTRSSLSNLFPRIHFLLFFGFTAGILV